MRKSELPPCLLAVAEVSALMRVSRMTVYRMVHTGQLPAVQFGRSYRIPEGGARAHLEVVGSGTALETA